MVNFTMEFCEVKARAIGTLYTVRLAMTFVSIARSPLRRLDTYTIALTPSSLMPH